MEPKLFRCSDIPLKVVEKNSLICTDAQTFKTIPINFRKDILLYLFDKNHAQAVGLNVTFIHYLFLSLTALTIVASLQAAGILLTVAMLIIPGCIAYLLTDRLNRMLVISACSAVVSSLIGTYVSYYLNGATGACIILTESFFFACAMVFAPKYGMLAHRRAAVKARLKLQKA